MKFLRLFRKRWVIIAIVIAALLGAGLFFYYYQIIFITKIFVRVDFSEAFTNRQTGNCQVFGQHVAEAYREIWIQKCVDEKKRETAPIVSYKIGEITIDGNHAYLQVELTRDSRILSTSKVTISPTYFANYEMLRVSRFPVEKWIINQDSQTP